MNHPQDSAQSAYGSELPLAYERLKQMAHFQAGFLGTASHELRAPINKIISLHQLILEDLCESPEEEREFLTQANQAIYQVLKNLDLLIQVSKLNIGAVKPSLQPVSLATVLGKVDDFMHMKCLNRHCRLGVHPPSPDGLIWSDSQWLQQLLMVLIDGALVAESSLIHLSVQTDEPPGATIKLTTDIAVTHWQGPEAECPAPGPEMELAELSPGFRYQLASLMIPHLKGTLTCSSTPEGGTEIEIQLPAAP